jgi:hypothetical protein
MDADDIHSQYRSEIDVNDSMNRSHLSAIEEARTEHKQRENELQSRLEKVACEDSALLKELRKRLENCQVREAQFKETINAIQEKVGPIYIKNVSL